MTASLDGKFSVQHLDAARMFAAAAFQFPLYTVSTCGWLRPEIIADERVRAFWAGLTSRVTPSDGEERAASAVIDAAFDAGIYADLNVWRTRLPETPMPQSYAAEISRLAWHRTVGRTTAELVQAITNQDDDAIRAAIDKLEATESSAPTQALNANQVHEAFIQALNTPRRNILTMLPPLDRAIGGLHRKNLTVVAGRPGMGKTALMLQLARSAAMNSHKALFYSIEMPKEQIWQRMAAPLVGLDQQAIDRGLTQQQRTALENASGELAENLGDNLLVDDDPNLVLDQLWQRSLRTAPDVIFLDHLSLMNDTSENEVKRLDMLSRKMKQLAKSIDCAFVLAVQLNRMVESRQDKRPVLSDLRDSGGIEQNADLVMMLYRDDYYSNTGVAPERSKTEIWNRKNRHGVPNTVVMADFVLKSQWFEQVQR